MAETYYKGPSTYVIYGEETAYGTGATPSSANNLGKITSITITVDNNQVLTHGLGDGSNATNVVQGGLDVTGTVEFEVNNFDFMQYGIGIRQGSGTVSDEFELAERDVIGFAADQTPSIELEVGAEGAGAGADDTWNITGVVFTTMTINFAENEIVTATVEFLGRTFTKGTSLTAVTIDTKRVLVFHDTAIQRDSTQWFGFTAFSVTINANPFSFRDLADQSRFIAKPARGIRRYEWSMTLKKAENTSLEDYKKAIQDLMSGATAPTETAVPTFFTLKAVGDQRFGSGAFHFEIALENCTQNNIDESIEVEEGITEPTFTGTALAGLTDGSDKVPIRYFTEA